MISALAYKLMQFQSEASAYGFTPSLTSPLGEGERINSFPRMKGKTRSDFVETLDLSEMRVLSKSTRPI